LTQIAKVQGTSGYLGKPLPFHYNAPFVAHPTRQSDPLAKVSSPFQKMMAGGSINEQNSDSSDSDQEKQGESMVNESVQESQH